MVITYELAVTAAVTFAFIIIINLAANHLANKSKAIHIKFLRSLLSIFVLIFGFYHILSLFDATKDISKTVMQGSALFLAIATFAAQQALGNIISGISISIAKPYSLGDKLKVISNGTVLAEGVVTDVTFRHTIIKTFDGHSNIVPNGIMDSSVILNTNYTDDVGNFIEFEISYNSDIDKAIELIKKAIMSHSLTIKHDKLRVTASRFTSNGVVLKTTVWTKTLDDSFMACSDIRISTLKAFNENNIIVPYNVITISNFEEANISEPIGPNNKSDNG